MKAFCGVREWRRGKWGLVSLLLVSLAIKVALLLSYGAINPDGVRYVDAARQFAQGNFLEGLRIDWMPFYALLIAAVHFLIRDWVLAGQVISLFSLVFALVPLYLLTKDLFDEKVAFWTGLAFALSPMLNEHAVDLLRDPVFLFFIFWSVYLCLRAIRTKKITFFALSSLSSIFALCCRLEAILLWAVFLLVLAALAIKSRAERLFLLKGMSVLVGFPLALGLLFGGGLLLAAKPDLVTYGHSEELSGQLKEVVSGNSIHYYKRKVSKGALKNYHSRYEKLKDLERTLPGWSNNGNLLETTRHYLPLIYLFSAVEALARNLFPLFFLPLLVGFKKRPILHRGHWIMLSLAGAYFIMAYYFLFTHDWISKRYILAPAVLLFPWVGLGLERICAGIAECRWPRIAMVLFLLVFCGVPSFKSLGDVIRNGQGRVIKEAGQWLARQPDLQSAVIACSDPRVRFYSSPEQKYVRHMESYSVSRNFKKMEKVAFDNNANLLVVKVSQKKRHQVPEFIYYSLLKKIVGIKNNVFIYSRNNKGLENG